MTDRNPFDRPQALRRAVWLGFGILLVQVGAGLPTPVYPRYQSRWHLSPTQLTLMFVALIAGILAALLVVGSGRIVTRHRATLLSCCGLGMLASAAFAQAGSVWLIVLAHLAQGMAIGGFSGVAPVAMSDPALPGGAQTVGRLVAVGNAVGLAAGPLWSGLLLEFAPWPGRLVFLLQLGLTAVLASAVLRYVPVGHEAPPAAMTRRMQDGLRLLPHRRRFLTICAAGCCAFALGGLYSSLGTLVARDLLGVRSEAVLGLVVTVLFTANAVAGAVLPRLGRHALIQLGLLLMAAGLSAATLAPYAGGVPLFFCGTVICGAGQGSVIAAGTAEVSSLREPEQRASATAMFFFTCYLGTAAAALATGAFATAYGLRAGSTVAGALIVSTSLGLVLPLRREREQHP